VTAGEAAGEAEAKRASREMDWPIGREGALVAGLAFETAFWRRLLMKKTVSRD
jgi:hypothetical protein